MPRNAAPPGAGARAAAERASESWQRSDSPKRPNPQLLRLRDLPRRHQRLLRGLASERGFRRIGALLAVMPDGARFGVSDLLDGRFAGAGVLLTIGAGNTAGFLSRPVARATFGSNAPLLGIFEAEADAREAETFIVGAMRLARDLVAVAETGAMVQ